MYFSSLETGRKHGCYWKHFSISHTVVLHSSDWKTVPVWGMELFPVLRMENNGFFHSTDWNTVPVWGMELFPVL